MERYISLSRAARLVGTTRTELQQRIQNGELQTFEGQLEMTELLRAYPEAQVEDNTMIERVERIMAEAVNKIQDEETLPDARALHLRLSHLGQELADAKASLCRYGWIIDEMTRMLDEAVAAGQTDPAALRDRFHRLLDDPSACPDFPRAAIARDRILSVLEAHVRLLPSGHDFFVQGNESLLEAALKAGLAVDYGCSNGACGKCRARVISGQVRQLRPHDHVFSEAEKLDGMILTCSYTPLTDVVLETAEASGSSDIPLQHIDARVRKFSMIDDHIGRLQLRTPRSRRLRFLAGQYAVLKGTDRIGATYSIASCPCDDMNLEFHVDMRLDTPLTRLLRDKPPATLHVEAPRGDFILQEDSEHSVIFVAWETGFAPVKSLVEHAMQREMAEDIHLFWAAPEGGHYQHNVCRAWDDALDNLYYHRLVADSPEALDMRAFERIESGLADYDLYVSGPESFCAQVRGHFIDRGLPADQVRCEPLRQGLEED
ncbi:MAG: ferredoxin [Gammaproteobacteria bacterium]|nr:MAG: ferredoxin [Gammaproteobacteria bacterium]